MSVSRRLEAPRPPAVVRQLCPSCMGIVGCDCKLCEGTGYRFVSTYAQDMGEQAWVRPDGSPL